MKIAGFESSQIQFNSIQVHSKSSINETSSAGMTARAEKVHSTCLVCLLVPLVINIWFSKISSRHASLEPRTLASVPRL
jgi:uncharacterized membrane protein